MGLAKLDPSKLYLLGHPMSSDQFARQDHQQHFGPSAHCGGGSGVILSHAMVTSFIGHVLHCIEGPPRTTLAWYWDEVELLGRCVYEYLRLNCTDITYATLKGEKP